MVNYVYDLSGKIDVNKTIDRMTKDDRKIREYIEDRIFDSRYKPTLDLNKLKELTPYAATLVAKYKGNGTVYLPNLDKTSWQALERLVKVKAKVLDLSGLKSLDLLKARAIGEFRGIALVFNGLESIDASVVSELTCFDGKALFFNGVKKLTPTQARNLLRFRGKEIFLYGLRSISLEVARLFLAWKGKIHI